jgi:hypothetical protein
MKQSTALCVIGTGLALGLAALLIASWAKWLFVISFGLAVTPWVINTIKQKINI